MAHDRFSLSVLGTVRQMRVCLGTVGSQELCRQVCSAPTSAPMELRPWGQASPLF